jgi:pSer/pThr/pTyr-binding forkhead associated (FHA) protein
VSGRKQISNYLAYRVADGTQRVVVWDTIDIHVGRRMSQDIVIPDVEVSREHARFRRENDRHLVEDLDTAIGTLVNGERITVHELQPGDVVRIGAFEFTYGRTDRPIRPGGNTRYVSELKSRVAVPAAVEGGGRTMLGIEMDDSDVFSAPTVVPPEHEVARAVSADGTLEEVANSDPLGLSLHPDSMGATDPVRDLDIDLDDAVATFDAPPLRPPDRRSPAADPGPVRKSEPASGATPPRLTMVLEIEAATFEIAALVTALYGKQIGHPLLRIKFKKPDEF